MEDPMAERLIMALDNQEHVLDEVKHLQISNEVLLKANKTLQRNNVFLTAVSGLLLIVIAVIVVGALWANGISKNSERASQAVVSLVTQQKAANAANVLAGCQNRNASARLVRQALMAQDAVLASLGVQQAVVDQLEATIPSQSDSEHDCTVPPDGLGTDDYPDPSG
jgi:hypothetical protein